MIVVERYRVKDTSRRYSIRQHVSGAFQIYEDNPYEGINQPYQYDDAPISGLFADIETAKAELLRIRPHENLISN